MLDVFHFTGFVASVKESKHVLAELKDCAFLTVSYLSIWNEYVNLRCLMLAVFNFTGFLASVNEAEHVLAELKDCAFLTVT